MDFRCVAIYRGPKTKPQSIITERDNEAVPQAGSMKGNETATTYI